MGVGVRWWTPGHPRQKCRLHTKRDTRTKVYKTHWKSNEIHAVKED